MAPKSKLGSVQEMFSKDINYIIYCVQETYIFYKTNPS